MQTIIEEIGIDSVIYYGKVKYNSNNHWINDVKPVDYEQIVDNGNMSNWIDKFRYDYIVINILEKDLKWMKEACAIGIVTRKFSNMFEEEKQDMLQRYNFIDKYFNGTRYFVRTNEVSLKHGIYGIGPYTDFESILESLCTCTIGHTSIHSLTKHVKVYLLPWIKLDYMNEYRVFVYKNNITCISQQHLYEKNYIFNKYDGEERGNKINETIKLITDYFNNVIKKKITYMENYSYDFAILPDNTPYMIEFNCFGKEYAAGSALFHWILDEDKLYNTEDKIYFRYAN